MGRGSSRARNTSRRTGRTGLSSRCLVVVPLVLLHAVAARGDSPAARLREIPLFTIARSLNKNQVQYAVRVDDHCAPVPGAPVFAYWRMLEEGPDRVAPLLPREVDAYGLKSQGLSARGDDGGEVRLVLRAVPSRAIVVETRREATGACHAVATAEIAGSKGHLFNVYAKLTWLLGVDYLLLRGWSMDGTHVLQERLEG